MAIEFVIARSWSLFTERPITSAMHGVLVLNTEEGNADGKPKILRNSDFSDRVRVVRTQSSEICSLAPTSLIIQRFLTAPSQSWMFLAFGSFNDFMIS
jgi:hypothetical protein